MSRIRIGISGWRYGPWRGRFYPRGLAQREELHYASRQFRSIELNGSFYSLQTPASYAHWYAQTPRGFVFAVKGPRFVTHLKRLRDVRVPLANFYASGVLELREKLGPILWQLPPNLRFDPAQLDAFLDALPRDSAQLGRLARGHDTRLKARARITPDRTRRVRHALEVRHPSFACDALVELLRRHRVALVVADAGGRWPYLEDVTADFMYLRLHGAEELYASGYGDAALADWARRIRAWARGAQPRGAHRASRHKPAERIGRDVYCYFDNDAKVRAPVDAHTLEGLLGRS